VTPHPARALLKLEVMSRILIFTIVFRFML
jgi:hypothetical protein